MLHHLGTYAIHTLDLYQYQVQFFDYFVKFDKAMKHFRRKIIFSVH